MSKTQTAPALDPTLFSVSQGIYEEDAQHVSEVLNYAFGLGLATTGVSMLSGSAQTPHPNSAWTGTVTQLVGFATGSGYTTRYEGRVMIDADAVSVGVTTQCTFPASNTGRVRITIGSGSAVLTHGAATTSIDTDTISVASIGGTGLQTITVELDHQTGSSPICWLEDWGWRTAERTSSLPNPVG